MKSSFAAQRGLELVHVVLVHVVVEVGDLERLLDATDALFGRHDGALRFVDLVVTVALQRLHDPRELEVERLRVVGTTRDDERRARLVDEDRVDLVDDREVVAALRLLLARRRHVVAQVVEPELVVRAVGDVGGVRGPLRVPVVDLRDDHADVETEESVDLAHPRRVALGEVVVHRHEVDAVARQRVQIGGQRGDEGLALAGLHLGHPAEVQGRAAHDLHVEVALAQRALARFPHGGERLGEQLVEEVDPRLAVVAGGGVDAGPELAGQGPDLLVAATLHLGLERGDLGHDRLEQLELAALAGVQHLLKETHRRLPAYRRRSRVLARRGACLCTGHEVCEHAPVTADTPGTEASAAAPERPSHWSFPDPAALALTALATAWVVVFSVLVVRRHNGFSDFGFDMGIYEQAVWLLAHGRGFMTVRGLPVFGHHGTFVLALFAPASWLGAGPNFLNVTQVVVLALGVVPLYQLARERHLPSWVAAVVGAALLLHPGVQFFSWELFHPETIAITPLLCAYLCSVRKSWRWFAFWAVLTVSCKEDLAIAVVVFGLLIAFRGDRRRGLAIAALAAVWFVLISQVLIPLVSGHPAAYEGLYSGVGGSPDGIVRTAFDDPGNITGRIFSSESADFAWRLVAPFGLVPVLAPAGMLIGAPQFLLDVISDVPWTREITYRYAALPVAGLAIAMVEGVAFARRRIGIIALYVATACVAAGALYGTLAWGPSPIGAEYDKGWWPLDGRPTPRREERRGRDRAVGCVGERDLHLRPAPQRPRRDLPMAEPVPKQLLGRARHSDAQAVTNRLGDHRPGDDGTGRHRDVQLAHHERQLQGRVRPRRNRRRAARPSLTPQRCPGAGVRAAVSAMTRDAPPWRRARAAADKVAPVVATSSTIRTEPVTMPRAVKAGPSRRALAGRSVCAGPSPRRSNGRAGRCSCRATARASSSAWSKPRARRRAVVVGAHVTTSGSGGPTSGAIASASQPVAACRRRYFTRATSSRATPS